MRHLSIFLVAFLVLIGLVAGQGSWYPQDIGIGKTIQSDAGTLYAGIPAIQLIDNPESTDDDQLLNYTGGAMNQTTNLLITSTHSYFIAQPDVARNIIVTFNASTSGSIKLTGTDISGASITENITISSASSGASTKAFLTVTRIDGDLTTGQTAKTVKVGTGNLLGLNKKLGTYDNILATFVNGVIEGTAAAATKSSTVLSTNTVDTNSAPGGYDTLVYYILQG